MFQHRVPILAPLAGILLAVMPVNFAFAESNVVIAAKETAVIVAPRHARLRLINLPSIDFALRAAIHCDGSPSSLTLSISDTFRTLDAAQLEGRRAIDAILTVPPRQMALAATARFCVDGDSESESELLVAGFVTAHASLQCEDENGVSAQFASAPLKLRLHCERPPAVEDQDSPSPESAEEDSSGGSI